MKNIRKFTIILLYINILKPNIHHFNAHSFIEDVMKKFHHLFILLTSLSSNYTFATDDTKASDFSFSGNTSLASEYRWRGQTQTKNDTALQGNILINHTSGFYVSAFASNVDSGDEAHLELDPLIGYSKPLTLGIFQPTLDIGMLRYHYVGKNDLNYNEYFLKMIFNDFLIPSDNFTPSVSYTNKYGGKATSEATGEDIKNWYFNLLYTTPFAQSNFGGITSLGYSKASKAIYGYEANDHFLDWKIGATYTYKPLSLNAELAAMGTNLDSSGFTDTNKKGIKTAAVFTLTKSF